MFGTFYYMWAEFSSQGEKLCKLNSSFIHNLKMILFLNMYNLCLCINYVINGYEIHQTCKVLYKHLIKIKTKK